ncbi:HD-GYP domain-containing protein [Brevibacillus sp. SYSU BS000544]|uniref:HD-GYP domain-containing protein n=1 Tax=Brevibacillus sp. SYSU BS000544 TaxID=3416443 RepID=UPI003CE50E63
MKASDQIGSRLKRDLFTKGGLLLASEKTILTDSLVQVISKNGVHVSNEDVEQVTQQEKTNESLVYRATEEMREIFEYIHSTGDIPLEELHMNIIPAIHHATEYPNLYSVLSGLQAKDDYTYRHNIGVAVISTMIGKWMHLNQEELNLLTLAAALHDVGKIKICDEILNKPGKFTDEEFNKMKQHTVFGFEIIQQISNLHPRVSLVALQHHEREDGCGYPNKVKGKQIDLFSKIVGVADVFHAMTSKRVYKEAQPFFKVIEQMMAERFGKLDPVICHVFVQRMMEMAVGSQVILSDGQKGRVTLIHQEDPIKPLVQLDNHYIDLRKCRNVQIEQLVG